MIQTPNPFAKHNSWHKYKPIAKSCGHPGDIENGFRDGTAHTFTSRITYGCNDGYELVGRANRYCQSNGQWSGVLPSCRRMFYIQLNPNHIQCHTMPSIVQTHASSDLICCPLVRSISGLSIEAINVHLGSSKTVVLCWKREVIVLWPLHPWSALPPLAHRYHNQLFSRFQSTFT